MAPLAPSDPRVLKRARALQRLAQLRAEATFEPRPSVAPRPDLEDLVDVDQEAPEDAVTAPAQAPASSRKAAVQRAVRLNRQGIPTVANQLNELVGVNDVLADWELLRDTGLPFTVIAERLHLLPHHLGQVLNRALAAGDPRGSREPFARDLTARQRRRKTLRLGREVHDEAAAS